MSDPVLVGTIVAVAIVLARVGLAESRRVADLGAQIAELSSEVEALRDDFEASTSPRRHDLGPYGEDP